ncbi:hypothetical protein QTL86_12780 [Cellulosilyticum sp. ST5]
MILKKDNIERIVVSQALIEKLKADDWVEVEKKKSTKKDKQEGAE